MVSLVRSSAVSWCLLAGYCLLIFIQSSLPSPDVGPDLPGQDKFLHLVAYAVLGYLACRSFASLRSLRSPLVIFTAGFIFAVLFGISDEWHQSFVPGRMADGWDLFADGVGAFLGAVGHSWRYRTVMTSGSTFPR
jgi:VanZ family protein